MTEQMDDRIVSSLCNDLENDSDNKMKEIKENCGYYTLQLLTTYKLEIFPFFI